MGQDFLDRQCLPENADEIVHLLLLLQPAHAWKWNWSEDDLTTYCILIRALPRPKNIWAMPTSPKIWKLKSLKEI